METERQAHTPADVLGGRRLAACAQIAGPISSVYWWKGELCSGAGWQCGFKSRSDLMPAVEDALTEAHPCDVPEILALPVVVGGDSYLAWMDAELAPMPVG